MLNIPEISKLNGIVVGRSDLTGSMGFDDKKYVDSDEIFKITRGVALKAKPQILKRPLVIEKERINFDVY